MKSLFLVLFSLSISQAFASPGDTTCNFNFQKYPEPSGLFEFNCSGGAIRFNVWCDLRATPSQSGGNNKLDIRQGVIRNSGRDMLLSSGALTVHCYDH